MNIFKSSLVSALLIALVTSPLGNAPAKAGAAEAVFGAVAGVALGAMIAGAMRPHYRSRGSYHSAHHRAERHHAVARHSAHHGTNTAIRSDPFAGASHSSAPVTTPARYQ